MAAQIPIRDDSEANEAAMEKVRADKRREAGDGHDGTWVAHPGLFTIAKEIFDPEMPQATRSPASARMCTLPPPIFSRSPRGRSPRPDCGRTLNVGIGYIEAWLRGTGCVPLYNLMEDAATAEVSPAQVWQWIRHGAKLEDGHTVDAALCRAVLDEDLAKLRETVGEEAYRRGRYEAAAKLFREPIEAPTFTEFPTIPAYDMISAGVA